MRQHGRILLVMVFALAFHSYPVLGENLAVTIWEEVESLKWDTSCEETGCERFRGRGGSAPKSMEWCFRCESEEEPLRTARYYYALELGQQRCRLEQYIAEVTSRPLWLPQARCDQDLESVHKELEKLISDEYGRASRPNRLILYDRGGPKRLIREWKTDDLLIHLLIFEDYGERPELILRVRHHHLANDMTHERALIRSYWDWHNRLDRILSEELRGTHPAIASLLEKRRGERTGVVGVLLTLMEELPHAEEDSLPPLLLAGDRLAASIPITMLEGNSDELLGRLEEAGLELDRNPPKYAHPYVHNLMWRVWENFPNTRWGDEAFFWLLGRQWSTRGYPGRDRFREVISVAEEYLKTPRERPTGVLFLLAQAYETWWSASQASPDDEYTQAGEYKEGSDEARRKAVTLFEEVIQEAPDSYEAAMARLVVPKLKLGYDTNQRSGFYIND